MLEECTNEEIEVATRLAFYTDEENFDCHIQRVRINRNLGVVSLAIGESSHSKIDWEKVIDFEEIDPFIKIDC